MTEGAGRRCDVDVRRFDNLFGGPRRARAGVATLPAWSRQWARDSALLLISQLLTFAATSVAAVVIARRLTPSDWGVFSAFLGLSFALAVFVEFGLATWLLRELSHVFAEHGDAATTEARALVAAAVAFAVTVMGLIVAAGVVAAEARGMRASFSIALVSLLLYGGLFACSNVLEPYLRAQRRLRRVVTASVVEKYVLVSLVVLSAVAGFGMWGIGLAYVAAGLLRVGLLGASVFQRTRPPVPSLGDIRAVLRRSLPFALMSGAVSVVPRLDALCLVSLSAVAAGYFSLGDRILTPALLVPAIGAMTLYPFLARRSHRPGAIWTLAAGFGLAGGLLAAAGFLLSPTIVPLVFGHRYAGAVPAVQLMLLSLPIIYAANPLMAYCNSTGRERAVVAAAIAAALVGTGAIVTGQLLEGVRGAATGMLVRQALMFCLFAAIAANATRADSRTADSSIPASVEPSLR